MSLYELSIAVVASSADRLQAESPHHARVVLLGEARDRSVEELRKPELSRKLCSASSARLRAGGEL